MSGGNINPGSTAPGQLVHAAFKADVPDWRYTGPATTLCLSTDKSRPVAEDWRYVSCPTCLALATPEQRAARDEQVARYPSGGA